MPDLTPVPLWVRQLALTIAGAAWLAGCTFDLESTPVPTATATAVSFGPNDVPVGTLLNDGSTAWDEVDAWVEETRIETPSDGSGESPATSVSTERVILPNQRYVLTTNGDTVVSEEILVDGTVYMRGTLVSSSIYPDVDADTWISLSPDQVPSGTILEQRVNYLTTPAGYPFADVTATTRELPTSPEGEVTVDERQCAVWEFSTTDDDAEGLQYQIAFDNEERPCQLVRAGGGVVETTSWSYPDEPEPVAPPVDAVRVQEFPSDPT